MNDVYAERSYGEIEVGFGEKIGILVGEDRPAARRRGG